MVRHPIRRSVRTQCGHGTDTGADMARITDKLVRSLETPAKGNRVVYDDDVRGFGVRITSKGARSFVLNYRFADVAHTGRRTSEYRHTIGAYPGWSVAAARKEAEDWRRRIDRGETHPLAERRSQRDAAKAAREAETFAEAVEDYITREQEGRRKNATASEIRRVLLRECAAWKATPIAAMTSADIRRLLEAIRDGEPKAKEPIKPRPYLANRTYAYLRTFFSWCAEPGIEKVSSSPMLGLRRPWEGEESRGRWYSDDEIAAIWRAADALGGVGGAFVKVLLLTGKRKGALAAMRWDELSEAGLWTPPADTRRRTRNKRVHAVPLPPLALRIIRPLRPASDAEEPSPYVFAGRRRGSHLDPGTPLQAAIKERSGVQDFMFHGLRHTVETRLAELGVPPHVRDVLLDHAPARGAGAGYDHHHYGAEMRDALATWARHVEGVVTPADVAVLR